MQIYLLDTDHISLIQRGDAKASTRYAAVPNEQVAASVISYEEQLRGRLAVIQQVRIPEQLSTAYRRLREMHEFFCQIWVLDFDESASNIFAGLRQQHRCLGTMICESPQLR